ncbi:PREDICTED: uncharacterized protein LOC109147846 [Ipomoea nil]|uniref:uncharacterized protein LOC109147846 n=1 Tax=Ipomoea nil TaxID=35883 RepID=UPI0009010D15|nr:PREDICTED: uncharacterized protein LOC109147846 [Ipomoea nil]
MLPNLSLKLIIDKKVHKVLYAEADKEFVDFLFCLMSFPIVTVVRNGCRDSMVGSLGKLYNSITNLPFANLQQMLNKRTILNPKLSIPPIEKAPQLFPRQMFATTNDKFYTCSKSKSSDHQTIYVSDRSSSVCPECSCFMSTELTYVFGRENALTSSESEVDGFVDGGVKYMVMDDLEVKRLPSASRSRVLEKLNVKDVGSIKEKDITLGYYTEHVDLLSHIHHGHYEPPRGMRDDRENY